MNGDEEEIDPTDESGFDLIVFDMDGVLVQAHSSWAWVHQHFGVDNDESLEAYLEGEIDDHEFMRRDISLWKEVKEDVCRQDIIQVLKDIPMMDGYKDCMDELKEKGYMTAIISGGLKPLALCFGEKDFDWIMANDVKENDGRLVTEGVLEVPLNDKGMAFQELVERAGVQEKRVVAVGNSFIDAPMLNRAGLGIAFNPADDEVREAADVIIDEKDLSLILKYI